MTDTLIHTLTKYYGLTIRKHPDSVNEMKRAVLATSYHVCSTNENRQHQYCPSGARSWCKWRFTEATGKLYEFEHQHAFPKRLRSSLANL